MSAFTCVEPGVSVGAYTFSAAYVDVDHDAPPYAIIQGSPYRVRGVNTENLKRCGFGDDDIRCLKQAYRELFAGGKIHADVLKRLLDDENIHVRRAARGSRRSPQARRGIMNSLKIIREIAPAAKVAPEAEIGPYCVVGPDVTIGPGTILRRRVCVFGHTTIGSGNIFEEGCIIGTKPQDLKYQGSPTLLIIGHRNYFGRKVTVHVGTEAGGCLTHIGDDNVLMEGCHVAHDCYVYDRTRLGRNAPARRPHLRPDRRGDRR